MTETSVASPPHEASVTVRAATVDDYLPAMRLLARLGLDAPTTGLHVNDRFTRLWVENPAVGLGEPMPPPGWVLESGGRVVGFFGTFPRRYRWGDEPLLLHTAASWGVEKAFRDHTQRLASAYFGQTP